MKIEIYTDGSSNNATGRAGWAAIILVNGEEKKAIAEGMRGTNNQAELTAAIMGLSAVKEGVSVTLYTDSAYVMNAFTKGWVRAWRKKGWLKSDQRPVKNVDLWERLDALVSSRNVTWRKVKGHSGDEWNEKADRLAKAAALGTELREGDYSGDGITAQEIARLWAVAHKSGYTRDAVRAVLGEYGLVSTKSITTHLYGEILAKLKSAALATMYNRRLADSRRTPATTHA